MVENVEEGDGKVFVLEDGRKFKSASSAASAVMGGKAVNGWRFWSVQGAEPKGKEGGEKPETQASKSKRLVYRVPNQKGIAEGQSRWFCRACMKGFVASGGGQPEAARRSPWRRPGADGGSRPSGGNERVGADAARGRGPFGGLSCRWDVISSWARRGESWR